MKKQDAIASLLTRSIAFAAGFRLLEGIIFAPLMGLAGQIARGRSVVDSTALASFFLSPKGLFALFFSGVCLLLIRMAEQAGLSVLRAQEFGAASLNPMPALRIVLAHAVRLLRAAGRIILLIGLMLAPLLTASGLVMRHLLSRHDINFYLAQRPRDFLFFSAILAGILLVTLAVILRKAVQWRWIVHVILFEQKTGKAAFERSAQLVKGAAWKIAFQWGAIAVLYAALGGAAAWVGRLILPAGAGLIGGSVTSLGVLLGCLIVMQAFIGSMILMAGPIIEAKVFTRGYFQRSGQDSAGLFDQAQKQARFSINALPRVYALLGLFFVGFGGVVGGIWGTQALSNDRPVTVIAHRAAVNGVPENSLPAIERAIADGADVAEIDVQLSRDGIVVLAHDSDFSRTAGVAKKVTELTWAEMQKIDVGSPVGKGFAGVRPPSLEQALKAARDRIRLTIELKHYAPVDGTLEQKVVELIHRHGVVDQIEVQALEYESLMAIRRLEPGLKIGYLFSMNARAPERLEVDFLSVLASRVDPRFVRKAHRANQKVYVWTVDKRVHMERLIDLGVDGLITNEAAAAAQVLRDRRALSSREKALRRIRTWLAG